MAEKSRFTRRATQDNFVTEKIDVIENNLLGTYDDDGEYVIAPQIIKELLSLEKVKKRTFANSVFCIGNLLGYGEIVFELVFDEKTHNGKSASATLYLLEDVHKINGYLQNTIKSRIEHFNENVENFIEETYKFFNIKAEDDEEDDDAEVLERKLKDDLDLEDSYIIAKKQYSLMFLKLTEEKLLDAYGKYFTSRIATLTKMDNDFSKAVLDRFNSQYALIQNIFLKEKNYEMLNELLDKSIEELSGTNAQYIIQEQQFNNLMKPALETFENSVDTIREKYRGKALNSLAKGDRKKVEAIFEDSKDVDLVEPEQHAVNQSAKQIVNDIPKSTYTLKNEKETKQEQSKVAAEPVGKSKEPVKEVEDNSSFYAAFKQNRSNIINVPQAVSGPSKVVDTERSRHIDSQENAEEIAASSLKDRMSRLERFKSQTAKETAPKTTEKSSSYYDMISRGKSNHGQSFGGMSSYDNVYNEVNNQMTQQELQQQREELLKQNQYMDMGEM